MAKDVNIVSANVPAYSLKCNDLCVDMRSFFLFIQPHPYLSGEIAEKSSVIIFIIVPPISKKIMPASLCDSPGARYAQ
jgi:hypothetical protein